MAGCISLSVRRPLLITRTPVPAFNVSVMVSSWVVAVSKFLWNDGDLPSCLKLLAAICADGNLDKPGSTEEQKQVL